MCLYESQFGDSISVFIPQQLRFNGAGTTSQALRLMAHLALVLVGSLGTSADLTCLQYYMEYGTSK